MKAELPSEEAFTGMVPIRIKPLKQGERFLVWFRDHIHGWITHWAGKRSELCLGSDRCHRSLHVKDEIWKGYAAALFSGSGRGPWRPCVIEITEAMEHSLRPYKLPDTVWQFSRTKSKTESIAKLEYLATMPREATEVQFSILPTLKRIYRVHEMPPEQQNPVPVPDRAEVVQLGQKFIEFLAQQLEKNEYECSSPPPTANGEDLGEFFRKEAAKRGMKLGSNGQG